MRSLAVAAALVLLLVGCVAPAADLDAGASAGAGVVTSERLAAPDVDFASVIVADHGGPNAGHAARPLHKGIQGFEVVGHTPLLDKAPLGSAGTGWGAIGIWKNYACVAQLAGTGSIAIVDIADPAKPTVLAQTEDGFVNGDCEFTADGNYLFAGAYLSAAPSVEPLMDLPIPGAGDLAAPGMHVWDVTDKSNPKHILYSDTGDYHTHFLHTNANGTYLVQAYTGKIYKFDPAGPTYEQVAEITPMEHDMWVAKHPVTGRTYLYSGAGQGVVIYDYEDPENPFQVGEWQPEEGARTEAWHRQATVDQLVDGKALLIAAGENCSDGKTEPYAVFDITDPANPLFLAEWELPGKPEAKGANLCTFSPHELSVFDGYVASGNYHAGVWLFDVGSAERMMAPATLGYFIPDVEPVGPRAGTLPFPWAPFVWGAFFDERGYVLTADAGSGLYILKVPGVTPE